MSDDSNHNDAPAPARDGAPPSRPSPRDEHHVPVLSVPGTGRRVAFAAAGVGLALVAVFVFGLLVRHHGNNALGAKAAADADAPPPVEVVHVRRAEPHKVLSLPGEAQAFNEAPVYARTSGYLSKWRFDIGDTVGTNVDNKVLAVIDAPELDDQLAAARAKVLQANTEVKLADAAVDFATLSFERWKKATPEGAVSPQERDQKESELKTGQAKLAAADADVAVAEAEVKRLETLEKYKNVVAPFAGTITQRNVQIGELVKADSTSGTKPLFTVAQTDTLRVFVDVPQSAATEIEVGMPAEVYQPDDPEHTFPGKVSRTSDALDPVSRTLEVEVLVENRDRVLKRGMSLQVDFQTDRHNPPLEIPAAALVMHSKGPQVAVIGPDGKVTFRDIRIAQDLGDRIEVASGLRYGERVALNIGSDVTDGERIDVHAADQAPPPEPQTRPAATATTGPSTRQAPPPPVTPDAPAGGGGPTTRGEDRGGS